MPRKKTTKRVRRVRGTGSIFWNQKREVWVARIPVGRHPGGGTKFRQRSSPTREGAAALLAALAGEPPESPPRDAITLGGWCDLWLDGLAVRPNTRKAYTQSVEYRIRPSLGHVPLASLGVAQVEAFVRGMARLPRADSGKPISPNTAALTHVHLGTCLKAAVRAGLIDSDPSARVPKPRRTRKAVTPLSPGELARVVAEASTAPLTLALAVLASTGMRAGECVALGVADFDPAAGTLRITKTQPGVKRNPVGPPKTERGNRVVRVPPSAIPAVAAAAWGRAEGPLFLSARGLRISPPVLATYFRALLARLGLAPRSLHQLRHSVATALVAGGMPPPDAARHLGDSADTVVRFYLHPTGADPAAFLESLFAAARKPGA